MKTLGHYWDKVKPSFALAASLTHCMKQHPHFISSLQGELYDWRLWMARAVVLAFAAIAGLTVVALTWMSEAAFEHFRAVQLQFWWTPLLWTPAATLAIVWATRKFAPGAGGSGRGRGMQLRVCRNYQAFC